MEVRYSLKLKKTLKYYFTAKDVVVTSGYNHEIIWQDVVDIKSLSERDFYSEYAWVVLSSGMKESVVRKKFIELSEIFEDWNHPKIISQSPSKYRRRALSVFNNKGKIDALIWMAGYLEKNSVKDEVESVQKYGVEYLLKFPFLGPATSFHFAKNIGVYISKPDRHLLRISTFLGYASPDSLCKNIASVIGEKESIVDLILWRYATLNKNYLTA